MDEALRFLETLMAPYVGLDDRLMLSLRFLAGQGLREKWAREGSSPDEIGRASAKSSRFVLTPGAIRAAAGFAVRQGTAGWNVYAGVLPRIDGERSKRGVMMAGWLWSEIDGQSAGTAGAMAILESAMGRGLMRPTMLVRSGGGLHLYWRLTEPTLILGENLDLFERTLRRLAVAVGGVEWYGCQLRIVDVSRPFADPTCCEAARILRVPGTVNWKRERPVELGWIEAGDVLSFAAWRGRLPGMPAPAERQGRGEGFSEGGLPARTVERIACPAAKGQRHAERVAIAVSAARSGFDEEAIRILLDTHARQCGSPGHVFKTNEQLANWAANHAR